ncbi:serine O-acetyltransferase EpsC [Methylobacillus flagellatus]|uniref:serine O-acetyltransferase n=1 Tax=Methylobacillus flagellatus (strain ATCC 51484 / DSM 6875 / VKM B-1610 / KT) TaxID=265072 RepID=Q1H3Q2_METFK|nr:serine O-acetyltransferase EpsC [Methylobacillus flagellatus]ABE48885.1 serine O-acetyltransferase [Methylobacillus flagellatus KT]
MSQLRNNAELGDELGISQIVTSLREVRLTALEHRNRLNRPPKLPARKALAGVVEGLGAALFPNRLGLPDLREEGIDYFVGHTLDVALRELVAQVRLELSFIAELDQVEDLKVRATALVREFASQLPAIRHLLDSDIRAAYEGDPAARSVDEVLVCYPGINAITHYRIAHVLHQLGVPLIARMITEIAHSATGIDIHPGAQIGEGFFIDHGTGVVIGETSIIGRHVRLYQAVTLGAKRFPVDADGTLVKGNARHPIVEDDVVIYAGATILGRITIGRGSVIGGNVWLTYSVPPNSNITQAQMGEGAPAGPRNGTVTHQ